MQTVAVTVLLAALASARSVEPRTATCVRTVTAVAGDSCRTVAQRCGESVDELLSHNRANLCSTMQIGEQLCCQTIERRAAANECRTIRADNGDGCASLAQKCGISGPDFTRYNGAEICSRLTIGQAVCCSEGELPDTRPQPNPDGSCQSVTLQSGDSCWEIMTKYGITEQDLNDFNKDNAAWDGCSTLLVGERVCISKGTPPSQ